jgi:adenylate kinase family enzyme
MQVKMKTTDQISQHVLSKAYVLGGSPCSGKSTIAERLEKEFGFQYYKVDDHEREHSKRSDPMLHPIMHQYATMSWDEIWMRPVQDQVEEEFEYYRERFEMIAQDLAMYHTEKPIILEGAAYLPELLAQHHANRKCVIFLVPTKEFQLHHYRQRPWINQILKECKNPEQAFENWMMRDHLFGKKILEQARERNYRTIMVNGKQTIDQQYEKIKTHFGFKK